VLKQNIMKEIILQFLLENTDVEGRYVGGGEEPQLIVFPESEDCNVNGFLTIMAERLEALLHSNQAER
jgi:hypothetical protein